MQEFSFKDNLAIFINHFTLAPMLNLERLQYVIQKSNPSVEFRYVLDRLQDDHVKRVILNMIESSGPVAFLDERLYQRDILDDTVINLLDDLRETMIAICKKTLLEQRKYRNAWKLKSIRQTGLLGMYNSLEAKQCTEQILSALRYTSLNGFKQYVKRLA